MNHAALLCRSIAAVWKPSLNPSINGSLNQQVLFEWSAVDADTNSTWSAVPTTATQKTLIVPGPVLVKHGQRHTLTLKASIQGADDNLAATTTVTVQAMRSPLAASLKGPSDFRAASTLVLSAADSFDPDGGLSDVVFVQGASSVCCSGLLAASVTLPQPTFLLHHLSAFVPQTCRLLSPCALTGPAPATTACPASAAAAAASRRAPGGRFPATR
jgi:hypothetical protein